MEDSLSTETAETRMPVNNLNLLSNDNIAEDRKERENGREGRFAVNDEEGDVVDLEAIGEVANPCPAFVCMGDDNHFVPTVDQFLYRRQDVFERVELEWLRVAYGGQLVDVTLNPP